MTSGRSIVTHALVQILTSQAPSLRRGQQQPQHHYGVPSDVNAGPQDDFGGIIPLLLRVVKILCVALAVIVISAASYLVFYFSVMPAKAAVEPLYFDYAPTRPQMLLSAHTSDTAGGSFTRSGFSTYIHRQLPPAMGDSDGDNELPLLMSHSPRAVVDLLVPQHVQWQACVPDVLTKRGNSNPLLTPGQAYYMEIDLDLPESTVNLITGMFGIVTELQSIHGSESAVITTARSQRSARIPFKSPWIRSLRNVFKLGPLLLGVSAEIERVTIPAFRQYVESHSHPLQRVVVQIIKPSHAVHVPEITGGVLRIGTELNSKQEILKDHFYICLCIGTTLFVGFYLLLYILCKFVWTRVQIWWIPADETPVVLDPDDLLNSADFNIFEENWPTPPTASAQNERDSSQTSPRESSYQSNYIPNDDDLTADSNPEPCGQYDTSSGEWEDLFYPATEGS